MLSEKVGETTASTESPKKRLLQMAMVTTGAPVAAVFIAAVILIRVMGRPLSEYLALGGLILLLLLPRVLLPGLIAVREKLYGFETARDHLKHTFSGRGSKLMTLLLLAALGMLAIHLTLLHWTRGTIWRYVTLIMVVMVLVQWTPIVHVMSAIDLDKQRLMDRLEPTTISIGKFILKALPLLLIFLLAWICLFGVAFVTIMGYGIGYAIIGVALAPCLYILGRRLVDRFTKSVVDRVAITQE